MDQPNNPSLNFNKMTALFIIIKYFVFAVVLRETSTEYTEYRPLAQICMISWRPATLTGTLWHMNSHDSVIFILRTTYQITISQQQRGTLLRIRNISFLSVCA